MVSTVAQIGPAGTESPAVPAVIDYLSVSLPATRNLLNQSNIPLRWTFTAPESGRLLIDTHLAFPLDNDETYVGWQVTLSITGVFATGTAPIQHYIDEFGDVVPTSGGVPPTFLLPGTQQRTYAYLVDVLEGEVYTITATPAQNTGSGAVPAYTSLLNVVLRISDYGSERTGPTPNQERRAVPVDTVGTSNFEAVATANHEYDEEWEYGPGKINYRSVQVGHYHLHRSFGGPPPFDDGDAVNCAWNHARHKSIPGFTYWSPGGVEWLGGPGVCQVVGTIGSGEGGAGTGNAGSRMTTRGWALGIFSYKELEVWTYWSVIYFGFEGCRQSFMTTLHLDWAEEEFGDGTQPGTGLYGNGFTLSWAPMSDPTEDIGEIIDLKVVPDEFLNGGSNVNDTTAEWFVKPAGVDSSYVWTPGNDEYNWPLTQFGQASGGGAKSLGSYSGGAAEWVQIEQEDILAAKAVEAARSNQFTVQAGLQFTLAAHHVESAHPPIWPNHSPETDSGTTWAIRQYQTLGFEMTGKYPDWIILDNPPYPDGSLGIAGRHIRDDRIFVGRQ